MKALFLVDYSPTLILPPATGAAAPEQQLNYTLADGSTRGGYWQIGDPDRTFRTALFGVQASPATIAWMMTQTTWIHLRNIRTMPELKTLYADADAQRSVFEALQSTLMPSDLNGQIAWALMTKKTNVTIGQLRTALAAVAELNDQPLCTGRDWTAPSEDAARATLFSNWLKADNRWTAAQVDAKDWSTESRRWASLRQLHRIKPDEWTQALMGDMSGD